MDPQGAAQPPLNTAYKVEGNPVTTNPAEEQASHQKPHGQRLEERLPGGQSSGLQDARPSALGAGVRDAPPGEERRAKSTDQVGRHPELEGEQMRAPGEGDVSAAVEGKPGATGAEPNLASDLDRKKAEQAAEREAIKEDRRHGTHTEGVDPRVLGSETLREA